VCMISEELRQIIEESKATRAGKGVGQIRYSDKLKSQILNLISNGKSTAEVSRLTGIDDWTLRLWVQRNKNKTERQFNELVVVEERKCDSIKIAKPHQVVQPEIILRGRSGIEISGFRFEEIHQMIMDGII